MCVGADDERSRLTRDGNTPTPKATLEAAGGESWALGRGSPSSHAHCPNWLVGAVWEAVAKVCRDVRSRGSKHVVDPGPSLMLERSELPDAAHPPLLQDAEVGDAGTAGA